MDCAVRWWRGKNHPDRISAGEHLRTVFWQRRVSHGKLALGHAGAACLPVPEVLQGAGEGDVGRKAQTDRPGATASGATALIPVLVLGGLPAHGFQEHWDWLYDLDAMQQVSSEFDPGAGSAPGHRECHVGEGPAKRRRIAEPRPDSHGEWR